MVLPPSMHELKPKQQKKEQQRSSQIAKILILALLLIAAAVFVMQVCRWKGAWIFVSLYWLTLTVKNFLDWRNRK